MMRRFVLGLVLLGGSACIVREAGGHVQQIDTNAIPSTPSTMPPGLLRIDATIEGRPFEELGILVVVASRESVRDRTLSRQAARMGADAIIDIQRAGKLPYLYLGRFVVGYKTQWVATAIRWTCAGPATGGASDGK